MEGIRRRFLLCQRVDGHRPDSPVAWVVGIPRQGSTSNNPSAPCQSSGDSAETPPPSSFPGWPLWISSSYDSLASGPGVHVAVEDANDLAAPGPATPLALSFGVARDGLVPLQKDDRAMGPAIRTRPIRHVIFYFANPMCQLLHEAYRSPCSLYRSDGSNVMRSARTNPQGGQHHPADRFAKCARIDHPKQAPRKPRQVFTPTVKEKRTVVNDCP